MSHMDWELHLELLKLEVKKEERGCDRTTSAVFTEDMGASLAGEAVKTLKNFFSIQNRKALGPACR